jgi:hypothetical protein
VTSQVLEKEKLLFEDRLIVENALSLWVGCLLHRGELFEEFLEPSHEGQPKPDEFLLTGLLYCPHEAVREEFRASLSALCSKTRPGSSVSPSPLDSTLRLLSSNFSLISEYACTQYFELFCELLDRHFLAAKVGVGAGLDVLDSEALLSAVIDQIRAENRKAQRARESKTIGAETEGKAPAGLFQGLISLAGKILDSFAGPS